MKDFIGKIKNIFSNESIGGKISNRAKFFLALPMMPSSIGNVLIHNAYIKYYSDVIGLDVRLVGWIYLIFGIWNAVNDPLLGVFIDRRRYTPQRGKYVYLMRVTAPLALFSSFAMLFAQPSWNEWLIFTFFLALLFIFDTAQTAYSISHANYILVAAPAKNERIDVSVIVAYLTNIGGFFSTIVPTLLLVGEKDKRLTVILFSGVLILNAFLYWIALRNIRDKAEMYEKDVHSEEGKLVQFLRESVKETFTSRSFITFVLYQILGRGPVVFYFTPFLYLMDHVFKFSGTQATSIDVSSGLIMFVFVPLLGYWMKKAGLKKSMILSAVPTALGFLSLYFVRSFWGAMLSYWVIITASQVATLSVSPMLGAIIDENEKRTNVRKAGLFTGLNALITIPVSGIQAAIFTSLIAWFGFVSGAPEQSSRALQGIRIGAGVIPFLFILMGIVPMLFSPINLAKEKELSEFSESHRRRDEQVDTAENVKP